MIVASNPKLKLQHAVKTPQSHNAGYPYITTSKDMSGHFAVMIWWNPDGFPEPYNTLYDRHADIEGAIADAQAWAAAEGLEYRP